MANPPPPGHEPPPIDPDAPFVRFMNGVLEIVYGTDPAAVQDPADAHELKLKVDALLATLPAPPRKLGVSLEHQALEMVAAAFEAADDSGLDLALGALALWPDCVEAYMFLGYATEDEPSMAIPMFTLGVMAGHAALGDEMFEEHAGEFWLIPETRPFMQALGELARVNREVGALDVAAAHYGEMLRLNPNDSQGVRYELAGIALEGAAPEMYMALRVAYAEDTSAIFGYGDVLMAYVQSGDSEATRTALRTAREANPHVIPLLTGAEPMPTELPDEYQAASPEEAALVADLVGPGWSGVPGALDWLRSQTGSAPGVRPKAPEKEKRSGPRSV